MDTLPCHVRVVDEAGVDRDVQIRVLTTGDDHGRFVQLVLD